MRIGAPFSCPYCKILFDAKESGQNNPERGSLELGFELRPLFKEAFQTLFQYIQLTLKLS
jgi:hypothetical protein